MEFNINKWIAENSQYIEKVVRLNIPRKCDYLYEDLVQDAILFCLEHKKYFNPERNTNFLTFIHKPLVRYIKAQKYVYADSLHRPEILYQYIPMISAIYNQRAGTEEPVTIEQIKLTYPNLAITQIKEILSRLDTSFNNEYTIDTGVVKILPDDKNSIQNIECKIDLSLEFKKRLLSINTLPLSYRDEFINYILYSFKEKDTSIKSYLDKCGYTTLKEQKACRARLLRARNNIITQSKLRNKGISKKTFNNKYLLNNNTDHIFRTYLERR